ncbi:Outer membrane protein assembly factor BamB precursor [Pirellula sp. SH-Sr6A]|uniref:outer membrane protein assembly factor BamB family protein n=1 Tax=Pirellula sp. SH-Sr6A TaxID=1632865 RepID=UPI00078DEA1B|nr:PQQ-binding-like beta-propeller repeat protein [Pirellula sp. SH-Sr6A]AMV30506.1 Outer membrane protein assembly factor BamB precursor [Pirellula sp. SH-Sr6A]
MLNARDAFFTLHRNGLLIAFGIVASCVLGATAERGAKADDWAVVRGNSQGTGVATGKLPKEPKVLWEFKTEDDQAGFEGTPVIAGGKVFLGDFQGNVYALDLATGQVVWKVKAKEGFVAAGAIQGDYLVMGDFSANIYCYRVHDGSEVWTGELDQAIVSGGNFVGDEVLLSSDSGSLYALDLKSGKQRWTYATGDQLRSTASLWNQIALLGGCDSKLHKIDIAKGEPVSEGEPLMAPTLSTPNIIGDVAIVPTQPGVVFAIDAKAGKILWSYEPDGGANADMRASSATLATWKDGTLEGVVVVPSRNKRLIGLDAATGKLKWETVLRKRSDASPVICDGRAWIGGSDGMVYAIDIESGKESWTYQLSGQILASPAIADGKLVIATEKGAIVCFGE